MLSVPTVSRLFLGNHVSHIGPSYVPLLARLMVTTWTAGVAIALLLLQNDYGRWRGAGASVEKIGEAAACAVKRLHLDHRMVQVRRVLVTSVASNHDSRDAAPRADQELLSYD